jgi:hypothetical protein
MTPEEIRLSADYELQHVIPIDKAGPFFMEVLGFKQPNKNAPKSKVLSIIAVLLVGAGSAFVSFKLFTNYKAFFSNQLFLTLIAFFPLLVIHECIHAIAYKRYGAAKVGFGASLKSMMVYAYAQNHVTTMKQLKWIAIAPFLVLTSLMIVLLFIIPQYSILLVTLLLIHSFACLGDFALVKYAIQNPTHVTWDDIEGKKEMYFYKKK